MAGPCSRRPLNRGLIGQCTRRNLESLGTFDVNEFLIGSFLSFPSAKVLGIIIILVPDVAEDGKARGEGYDMLGFTLDPDPDPDPAACICI